MISLSDVNITLYLDSPISRIKDRHRACPVNCIIHPTSILYGTRIIISLVMHLRNLSEQTETAVRYPAVSSLFKVGRFHAVLVRTEFARIQGRNPFVRNTRSPSMDRIYIEIFSIICYNIYVLVLFPINRTAPYRSYAVIWCCFVPFNTKKGMRISPMSIISLSYYQTFHPATQAQLMPSLEL